MTLIFCIECHNFPESLGNISSNWKNAVKYDLQEVYTTLK